MAPIGTLGTDHYQPAAKCVRYLTFSPWILKLTLFFRSLFRLNRRLGRPEIAEAAEYVHMTDNKKPEFLSKLPHGKIPAFESQHGFKLFEAAAIARYGQ